MNITVWHAVADDHGGTRGVVALSEKAGQDWILEQVGKSREEYQKWADGFGDGPQDGNCFFDYVQYHADSLDTYNLDSTEFSLATADSRGKQRQPQLTDGTMRRIAAGTAKFLRGLGPIVPSATTAQQVLEYDRTLNALEISPNGDDYNAVIELLMGKPYRAPHVEGR